MSVRVRTTFFHVVFTGAAGKVLYDNRIALDGEGVAPDVAVGETFQIKDNTVNRIGTVTQVSRYAELDNQSLNFATQISVEDQSPNPPPA